MADLDRYWPVLNLLPEKTVVGLDVNLTTQCRGTSPRLKQPAHVTPPLAGTMRARDAAPLPHDVIGHLHLSFHQVIWILWRTDCHTNTENSRICYLLRCTYASHGLSSVRASNSVHSFGAFHRPN
jgi:hypothetical protein